MEELYECRYGLQHPRGLALIINMYTVEGQSVRLGSDNDVRCLEVLFKDMNYEVIKIIDLTSHELWTNLSNFANDERHVTADSVVVVVMSHGLQGNDFTMSEFLTKDGERHGSQQIVHRFVNAEKLAGKPKIFIFNFCRGPLDHTGAALSDEASQRSSFVDVGMDVVDAVVTPMIRSTSMGRNCEDVLIFYSTLPGYVSERNEYLGSQAMQTFCKTAQENAIRLDAHDLFRKVDQELKADGCRLTSESINRGLNKRFYFYSYVALRQHYIDNCQEPVLPWCPEYSWNTEEVYVDLELDLNRGADYFQAKEIFDRTQEANRIVIEGNPGYGKSTLMRKLTIDWTRGKKYLQRFNLVFLVKLNAVAQVQENRTLAEYMEEIYGETLKNAGSGFGNIDVLLKSEQASRILLLLDGYEEAGEQTKGEVNKILNGFQWKGCHAILTARPKRIPSTAISRTQRMSIIGFGKPQMNLAVSNFFIKCNGLPKEVVLDVIKDIKPTDLEFIKVNTLPPHHEPVTKEDFSDFVGKLSNVEPYVSLTKSPLICIMLCCLFKDKKGKLPDNRVDLYFDLINLNLYRSALKKSPDDEWDWDELKRNFPKSHRESVGLFSRYCFEALKTDNVCFSHSKLTASDSEQSASNLVSELMEAGVIIRDDTLSTKSMLKRQTFYVMPHRTFADFLAAYHLSLIKNSEELKRLVMDLYFHDYVTFCEVGFFLRDMSLLPILVDALRHVKIPIEIIFPLPHRNAEALTEDWWQRLLPALPDMGLQFASGRNDQIARILIETLITHKNSVRPNLSVELFCHKSVVTEQLFESIISYFSQSGMLKSLTIYDTWDNSVKDNVLDNNNSHPKLVFNGFSCSYNLNWVEWYTSKRGFHFPCVELPLELIDNDKKELTRLLSSESCPICLTLLGKINQLSNVAKALQEAPDNCKLAALSLKLKNDLQCEGLTLRSLTQKLHRINKQAVQQIQRIVEVLGRNKNVNRFAVAVHANFSVSTDVNNLIGPIVKELPYSGKLHHLSSLRIDVQRTLQGNELRDLILGVCQSSLERLTLENMQLMFTEANMMSATTDSIQRGDFQESQCRLRSLVLEGMSFEMLSALRKRVSARAYKFALVSLDILRIQCAPELLDWFFENISLPSLRCLNLEIPTLNVAEHECSHFNKIMEHISKTNRNTLEKLKLRYGAPHDESRVIVPVKECVMHCTQLHTVQLDFPLSGKYFLDPFPFFFFFSTENPMKLPNPETENMNPYLSLARVVLDLPRLRHLRFPLIPHEQHKEFFYDFFHAIADRASKWTGRKIEDSASEEKVKLSLTIECQARVAAMAGGVFKQRGIKFEICYVKERHYEFWFPES